MRNIISNPATTALAFFAATLASAQLPDENYRWPMQIPLDELRQITASLAEKYPELIASPGVKAAFLSEYEDQPDHATVFYLPHRESSGIKEAYEARCERENANQTWACDSVLPRRYLQLANQTYEVRLLRDVPVEHSIPAIHAAKRDIRTALADDAVVPDTVLNLRPNRNDGYQVALADSMGNNHVTMIVRLNEGGDASNLNDWTAAVLSTAADRHVDWLVGPAVSDHVPGLFAVSHYFTDGKFSGYVISPGVNADRFASLGLEPGDLLTQINGHPVPPNTISLSRVAQTLKDGQLVNVTVERGADRKAMEIGLRLESEY